MGEAILSGNESREAANRQLFRQIGEFLATHALAPTPGNYALVFEILTAPASVLAEMVDDLTADGLRLSEVDAAQLRSKLTREDGAPAALDLEVFAEARRSMEGFATIVEETRTEAANYQRDLSQQAAELTDRPPGDIAGLLLITSRMLERTRSAEDQLKAVRSEAEGLRRKLAEAEDEARSDPLTRLPNRRAFENRLEELLAEGAVASLGVCDVDAFKSINDRHGHPVGDRVLRMVAEVLQAACPDCMVARLGGEEFVILFEGMEPDEAGKMLDAAREDLASRNFRVRGTDEPIGQITFSGGVARCTSGTGDDAPMKRADSLLYRAKNSGRNRVAVEGRDS